MEKEFSEIDVDLPVGTSWFVNRDENMKEGLISGDKSRFNDATIFSSVVNLTNSIIGSGILGLPYAFAASGWVLGYLFITLSAIATMLSLHLLSQCCTKVEHPASFYKVTEASIPRFTFLVDLSVATMCFGVGLSYLIVVGGLMPDVLSHFGATGSLTERYIWIFIGFCIVAPLSCFKNIDALKYTSAAAIVFVVFIACLVVSYALDPSALPPCPDDDGTCKGDTTNAEFDMSTVGRLGIFIFAYSCQMNIFPVVNELKNPTQTRVDYAIYWSIFIAFSLYCIVAGPGYHVYGDNVESNILSSFPKTNLTSVARIFVSVLVSFSYPLLCNPGRKSAMSLWAMTDEDENKAIEHFNFRFAVITAVFLFGSLGLSMVVTSLGVVLAVIGATGSTVVTFILPGAAYSVLYKTEGPLWKRIGALGLMGFGIVFMPVALIFTFIE